MKLGNIFFAILLLSIAATAKTLQNGQLSVVINDATGEFVVTDLAVQKQWKSAKILASTPLVNTNFNFKLEGRELVITLNGVKTPTEFPFPITSNIGERTLLPHGCGFAFKADDRDLGEGFPNVMTVYGRDCNLACWGHFEENKKAGYLAIIATPWDAKLNFAVRTNDLRQASIIWQPTTEDYPRVMRFVFFTHCNEMTCALRYREEMKKNGYYMTFEEKMRRKPRLAKTIRTLAGAANVWYWSEEGNKAGVARKLKDLGLKRFMFSFATRHDLGVWRTADEVRAIAALDGVITSEYDIYRDTMEPEYLPYVDSVRPYWCPEAAADNALVFYQNGQKQRGWRVDCKKEIPGVGKAIGCAAICEACAPKYMRKRIGESLKEYPYTARMLDVTGGSLCSCFNPAHPLTRRSSLGAKKKMFAVVEEEFNLAAGTEDGFEALVPDCCYLEGCFSAPNHYRVDGGRFMWKIYDEVPEKIARGLDETRRVPFWEMVFHGCINSYWYWCDYNNKFPSLWAKRDLFNAVCGTPPMYFFDEESFRTQQAELAKSIARATTVAQLTAFSPMTDYRFLTNDRRVHQSRFANGIVVTANFSDKPFVLNGKTINAHEMQVEK